MKSATLFSALHKSREVSRIALDRMGDYLELLRVEMRIREREIGLRLAGYAVAGLFGFLATLFFGVAVIVSFWDSSYRPLAAWIVVLLYGGIAAAGVRFCLQRTPSQSIAATLQSEMRRDIDIIRESL